jgi:hypothetical protein
MKANPSPCFQLNLKIPLFNGVGELTSSPQGWGTVTFWHLRVRGSVPLTYGSGFRFFRHRLTRCQQTYVFLLSTFITIFKDKKRSKIIFKKYSRFFFMLADGRIRIQIRTNIDGSGSGEPKTVRIQKRIQIHNTDSTSLFIVPNTCQTNVILFEAGKINF